MHDTFIVLNAILFLHFHVQWKVYLKLFILIFFSFVLPD